jgi:hypothetical protein
MVMPARRQNMSFARAGLHGLIGRCFGQGSLLRQEGILGESIKRAKHCKFSVRDRV